MSITIHAKNFDITKSIRHYVNENFEQLSFKGDNQTALHVTLTVGKNLNEAEASIFINNKLVKVSTSDKDLYVAIDKLSTKLEYQINKTKKARTSYEHKSIRHSENTKEVEHQMSEVKEPIVKRKQFDLKPMMEEEAILQMKLLGHDFFFFFNGEIDKTCLLYKRKDGNYGLIESVYN